MDYEAITGTVKLKFSDGDVLHAPKLFLTTFSSFKDLFNEFPDSNEVIEIPDPIDRNTVKELMDHLCSRLEEKSTPLIFSNRLKGVFLACYLQMKKPSLSTLFSYEIKDNETLNEYIQCLKTYGWNRATVETLVSSLNVSKVESLSMSRALIENCIDALKSDCLILCSENKESPNLAYLIDCDDETFIYPLSSRVEVLDSQTIFHEEIDGEVVLRNIRNQKLKELQYRNITIDANYIVGVESNAVFFMSKHDYTIIKKIAVPEKVSNYAVSPYNGDVAISLASGKIKIFSSHNCLEKFTLSGYHKGSEMVYSKDYLIVKDNFIIRFYGIARNYSNVFSNVSKTLPIISKSGKRAIMHGNVIDLDSKEIVWSGTIQSHMLACFGLSDDVLYLVDNDLRILYTVNLITGIKSVSVKKLQKIKSMCICPDKIVKYPVLSERLTKQLAYLS